MLGKQLQTAAAGNAGGGALGIEDVFSTYLYTGTGSNLTITNGIDLAGEGGLVWVKNRESAYSNSLFDTERGPLYRLSSNETNASVFISGSLTSFNSSGFSLGASNLQWNESGKKLTSWTFRKAEKFFDVVTYTGDAVAGRTVAHNLGSVPGFILVKRTDTGFTWRGYHRSLGATKTISLDSTGAALTNATIFNDTEPTDTEFTLGNSTSVNGLSGTYVAYLFAHDAGGFGDDGTESVIKCGSYTTDGSGNFTEVNLGWEPQWLLVKRSDSSTGGNWLLLDNMRGLGVSASTFLYPNLSNEEVTNTVGFVHLTPTGFKGVSPTQQQSNATYIYIAIRRGPMKTPTDATEVFNATAYAGTGAGQSVSTGFPVDATLVKCRSTASTSTEVWDRLRGTKPYLFTDSTAAEGSAFPNPQWLIDRMDGFTWESEDAFSNTSGRTFASWNFRRAPGFFDVVAYQGTGVARTVSHNLGVTPEMMIIRHRNADGQHWCVYHEHLGNTYRQRLNLDIASGFGTNFFNSTSPTSSVFTVGTDSEVNKSTSGYIAYLFASAPGVSKVGSYTGTASTLNVDCGFSAGARFVLIKRTDSTGDWYVWDTTRGIVSGNDPYLLLNSTAAEVTTTDYIDPYSAGFTVTSTAPAALNASGGTYIFLAIA